MQFLRHDAPNWLVQAEKARVAAEQLADRDAKETMLELAQFYLRLAHADTARRIAEVGAFYANSYLPSGALKN